MNDGGRKGFEWGQMVRGKDKTIIMNKGGGGGGDRDNYGE